ncbi:MAG: NAD(P)-binding domain-containing protein, partial [Bacillota bacterium]
MDQQSPKVAVIGLGFIGLPLALSYAMRGCQVVGIDTDEQLVADINRGVTSLLESDHGRSIAQILRQELDSGRFRAVSQYAESPPVDHYILTVGIPIVDTEPDMSHLESACRSLAGILKPGDLVLVRSTVVPGTTEERILPLLESGGL